MSSSTTSAGTSIAERPVQDNSHKGIIRKAVGLVLLAGLLVAMYMNTMFLTPAQEEELMPKPFSSIEYSTEQFPIITDKIIDKAVSIDELAVAINSNLETAAKKYGVDSGSGKYTVPVKAEGVVESVDQNWIVIRAEGVAEAIRVPIGAALNGTPIRDVTGEIVFGDFDNQTDYQAVANEFKILMENKIIKTLDKASLPQKKVTVYGAWVTGGAPGQYLIQPVKFEVM